MRCSAVIVNFDFAPMVEGIPSRLTIQVSIPSLNNVTISLYPVMGTIEGLAQRFDFIYNRIGPVYDFKNFIGRDCVVEVDRNALVTGRWIGFAQTKN